MRDFDIACPIDLLQRHLSGVNIMQEIDTDLFRFDPKWASCLCVLSPAERDGREAIPLAAQSFLMAMLRKETGSL